MVFLERAAPSLLRETLARGESKRSRGSLPVLPSLSNLIVTGVTVKALQDFPWASEHRLTQGLPGGAWRGSAGCGF